MSKFKPIKVFFNGERLRDVYPHATRYQLFKYRAAKFFRKIVITSAALAILALTYFIGTKGAGHEIVAVVAQPAYAEETMEGKVDALKEKLLDEMVNCENPTHVLVNPDDNKAGTLPLKDKVSIGDLQFKLSTIQHFHKTLTGTTLTDREALMLGLDSQKARELALNAWINIKGSINQWTCASQSMKEKIEVIRFLTK